MNNQAVDLAFIGFGSVGRAALELARTRPWIRPQLIVRRNSSPTLSVRDIPVYSVDDISGALYEFRPTVAIVATESGLSGVITVVESCINAGVHVLCTSEELAAPQRREGLAALEMKAKEAEVVVCATGINPGFVFDTLVVSLSGASWNVDSIRVERVLDASVFGRGVHRSLGIGYSIDEFESEFDARRIRGHVGFEESAELIATSMGVELDGFETHIEPILALATHALDNEYVVAEGTTAGVTQSAVASASGSPWIHFTLSLHISPSAMGWDVHDRIQIQGTNPIDMTIRPGLGAVSTTAARLINSIPRLLASAPGLYSSLDLFPNPPWMAINLPRSSRGRSLPST